jgi:hypothetical protein
MCLSAHVSFAAAAALIPAGAFAVNRALKVDRRFLALAALPVFFGLQQYFEGMVWLAGAAGDEGAVSVNSLAYMFFAWVAWPVWVPISGYFIETGRRRLLYIAFAIGGAMLGALLYVPYFAHDGWLTIRFLERAIVYDTTELLDFIMAREFTYGIYVFFVAAPLLISRDRHVRFFGLLVAGALAVTYAFFQYAHISVFCFGGALASLYLVSAMLQKKQAASAA